MSAAAAAMIPDAVPYPLGFPARRKSRAKPPDPNAYVWTRGDTLALAMESCASCRGLGMYYPFPVTRPLWGRPCNCVLRAIFRVCFARYREAMAVRGNPSTVWRDGEWGQTECMHGVRHPRRNEEYLADFCLLARRTLKATDYPVFRLHFLLGLEQKECCRRIGTDAGTFYTAVYRVQQVLGRAFRETRPYSLYPIAEYFSA